MANVYATKTGNWSDTTVWNTGALPTSNDDVYANTYTVTIDQNVTVLSIRNGSATGITQGGGFTCSTARTINVSGVGVQANGTNTACLTLTHASGTTVSVIGNVQGATTNHTGAGITITGDGTTNVTGTVTGGGTAGTGSARGISTSAAATLNVTGNVTGGAGSNARGIEHAGTTNLTLNVTGDVSGSNATGAWAITNINTGGTVSMTITGNLTGASNTSNATEAIGTFNTVTTNVTITGTLTASGRPAIQISNTTNLTVAGSFISSATGRPPITGDGLIKLAPVATTEYRFLKSTGGTTSLYSADYGGQASPADVRYGILYGTGNALTGTLRVPPANSVASGVPVDNTTGTAALLLNDVAAVVAAQIAATLGTPP